MVYGGIRGVINVSLPFKGIHGRGKMGERNGLSEEAIFTGSVRYVDFKARKKILVNFFCRKMHHLLSRIFLGPLGPSSFVRLPITGKELMQGAKLTCVHFKKGPTCTVN